MIKVRLGKTFMTRSDSGILLKNYDSSVSPWKDERGKK